MKVILIAVGTRGDVEPFLALAEHYKKEDHEVVCAFPAQFEHLAKEIGVRFFPLAKEFLDMLDSIDGRTALGGGESILKRFQAYRGLYKQNKVVSYELMCQQRDVIKQEKPDLVLHSVKAMYPIFWHLVNPDKVAVISPVPCVVHPVDDMASIFLLGKNLGKTINRFSYRFSEKMSMRFAAGQLRRMGHPTVTTREMINSFSSTKFVFTISPFLFPAPPYWPDHVKVVGYLERDKKIHWTPTVELETFLSKNTAPLFITFGSMTNPDPEGKTSRILDLLEKHQTPAIINTAAGGLVEPENYNRENVLFLSDIPYDWIFPRVKAVIHHGGAGTTHLALKYGCPSMIIPHIPDQHLWNNIISKAGAGPKGPPVAKIDDPSFEEKLLELQSNPGYKARASDIGKKLMEENALEAMDTFLEVR